MSDEPVQICFAVLDDHYGDELQIMSGLQAVMSEKELDAETENRIAQWFKDKYGE